MTVKQKQCLLAYLGYDPGPIDGLDGPKTQAALECFRADYGVGADGLAGAVGGMVPKLQKPESTHADNPQTGTFWDDIPNFTRQEFACPCPRCNGFPAEPAEKLVRAAQALRNTVGRPMHISSGVRCPAHNAEVGGEANSRHMIGHATDFRVEGMASAQVLPLAQATRGIVYAYAIDDSYVHMDIGG